MSLKHDLQWAVEADQLQVDYQPIVRLVDSRVVGFEALLRWDHPVRGVLPPAEFIGLAEESGLIVSIGVVGHPRGVPCRPVTWPTPTPSGARWA